MEYLVIDIGTSSLRTLLMNESAEIMASKVKQLHIPGIVDAEKLWMHLCGMAKALELDRHDIAAVAVSSLLGWVGVDRCGEAATMCYTYTHACKEVYNALELDKMRGRIYSIAGRRANPELGIFQLLHVQKTDPEAYIRVAALISLKDYINAKLTGRIAMDRTTAGYTMVYDTAIGRWHSELLHALKADESKLPDLLSPAELLGEVSDKVAQSMGLKAGTPVVVGSVDGSTGILGAGGLEPGTLISVMGTTDTSFLVTDRPLRDSTQSLVLNPHVVPDRWLLGGPTGVYGGAVDWLQSTLLSKGKSLKELTEEAERLPRGSEGLFFFPTLAGERAPFWQPALRGTVVGIEAKHTPAHFLRGILEGNAYVLKYMMDLMQASGGTIRRAISIGGGSKNNLWLQIKAEVLGIPVVRTTVQEATARGSCLLAQTALKQTVHAGLEVQQEFYGSAEAVEEYRDICRRYMELHKKVVELYPI